LVRGIGEGMHAPFFFVGNGPQRGGRSVAECNHKIPLHQTIYHVNRWNTKHFTAK